MRTAGLSWTNWGTKWSSAADENVGSVDVLREHVKAMIDEEKLLLARGLLPSRERALQSEDAMKAECPLPQMRRKTFKTLGTPTAQADALSNDRTELSQAELLARADRRRSDLEAAGQIDMVQDRQPYPSGQVMQLLPCSQVGSIS